MENASKTPIIYECKKCDYITYHKGDYTKHISTLKHKKNPNSDILEINGNKKSPSPSNNYKFTCEMCNYNTNNKRDFDRHNNRPKHINKTNYQIEEKMNTCDKCNKQFTTTSGLWKHLKKCEKIVNLPRNNNISVDLIKEVIRESKELQNVLIEQNKELQNKLLEQNKLHKEEILELAKNQSIVNNNTTNNTTNNQFNLQFFLNETCKDAMNIVDFINSLQLTTDDFETTGKLGFVDGISRIFIKELKKLETEKLPIHCTDLKRETVYIKDNNVWEKENNEKQKLKWTIDKIAELNLVQHHNWQEKYPVCRENNTKENEYFFKLAAVALGGKGEDEKDKYRDKIMRNVLKEVVLDKKSVILK